MSSKERQERKAEIKEYRVLLKLLEKNHRRDLALHLYTSVILHGLNPVFPKKRWYRWPLSVDNVPDPRTQFRYCDNKELKFDPEVNEIEIYRKLQARKKMKRSENDTGLYVNTDETLVYINDFEDDKEEQETDLNTMELREHSDFSASDVDDDSQVAVDTILPSESESEDDMNQETELKHYTPAQVVLTKKTTDHKVDFFLEVKALLQRTIHRKICEMNLPDNQGTAAELDHQYIDEMARKLCLKYDRVIQELHKLMIHQSSKFNSLLTWQDILLADLKLSKDSLDLLEKKNELYQKLEKLFVAPSYNFKYLPESNKASDVFKYKEYLEMQGANLDLLMKAKIEEKKSLDFKRNMFEHKYQQKKTLIETSHDKGVIKAPRRYTDKPGSIQDSMIKHGGLRVSKGAYKFNFES